MPRRSMIHRPLTRLTFTVQIICSAILLVALTILPGCDSDKSIRRETATNETATVDSADSNQRIQQIMDSEKLVLELGPYIADIGRLLTGAGKPRSEVAEIFAESVQYTPLANVAVADLINSAPQDSDSRKTSVAHAAIWHAHWPTTAEISVTNLLDELWQPITSQHQFIECQFGTEAGVLNEAKNRFAATMVFEGKFLLDSQTVGVKAKQIVEWARIDQIWYVVRWEQKSFDLVTSQQNLFVDMTDQAIPDPATRTAVAKSSHEEISLDRIAAGTVMQPLIPQHRKFNDWESTFQFPSVSVVDYDSDGWDDLFLLDRWSPAMLLRNNGDGTFTDATAAANLAVDRFTNCALFADFDNDGDPDLFAGRTVAGSQFFRNENGKFVRDMSMDQELNMIRMVTSGSVVDINNDGLLDVYLATYAPSMAIDDWQGLADPQDVSRLAQNEHQHPYLDRGGPSNFVLLNTGGRLEKVSVGDELRQWRNTYQSVWSDWDDDGDQDLYVCNDFAPDAFLRNDTVAGSIVPKFTDVSQTLLIDGKMGFGMGANFGDYDSDGDLDLYVSNMYSKAGKRIIKLAGEVDERILASSQGNFLYQKSAAGFKQVAGLENGQQQVSKVGWSFGGQFADFDNDGSLDLYVPSGFYSAPETVRSDADL